MAVRSIGVPPRVTSWASSSSSRSSKTSRLDSGSARPGAAQDRADPRDQLLEAERLGDVVVAADRQPADLVLGGVAGGQEDDRHPCVLGARGAGRPRSPPCRGASRRGRSGAAGRTLTAASASRAGAGGLDVEALEAQGHGDDVDDVGLVVDDEDAVGFDRRRSCVHHCRGSCDFPRSARRPQRLPRCHPRRRFGHRPRAALRSRRAPPVPLSPRRLDQPAGPRPRAQPVGPRPQRLGQRLLLGRGSLDERELAQLLLRLVRRQRRDDRRQAADGPLGPGAVGEVFGFRSLASSSRRR